MLLGFDSKEVRVCIAGMGKMGGYHLHALEQLMAGQYEPYYKGDVEKQLSKIRIAGVCDVDEEHLASFPQYDHYVDYAKMLDDSKPDIIVIAVPTKLHFEFVAAALKKGIHVLVEKPLVTRKAEMDELVRLAKENGCKLISGHVERYNPVAIKIVSMIRERQVNPQSYSFRRTQKHHERIPDDIIVDKVVHDLDLARYFFGPVKGVNVERSRRFEGQVYEAQINVEHQSGVQGELFVSWLVEADAKERTVRIECEDCEVRGDFKEKKLRVDGKEVDCEVPGWITPSNNQIKDELVDFIMYCSESTEQARLVEPLLSLGEVEESISLIEQIARSVNA
ncbi:Glucose--fructose oxidoreductase precursor [Anaerohalosphaera lusitana]|uniref:Glucose--fructose oxidoreductase n=1 Tax=Anaerohalosphaera lusitana TaxID=1936003 RepID=A0A1U9NNI6_9BACT|nr:Gfo/Idh/MocA family oxidoreductase [Anaerohalosphaera lusitana]AQT69512.1 Glucose--fructose oxidoreductase precursor [Anaerohalosphaera lusitana]